MKKIQQVVDYPHAVHSCSFSDGFAIGCAVTFDYSLRHLVNSEEKRDVTLPQ